MVLLCIDTFFSFYTLQALKGLQLVLSPMENEDDDDVQVIASKISKVD